MIKRKDLTTNNGDIRRDAEYRAGWNACLDAQHKLKAQWQAEVLDEVADIAEKTGLNAHPNVLRMKAKDKRRQAENVCHGPGKCDDQGCPAHYAEEDQP